MISLFPASVRNAALQEYRFQLALVGYLYDSLQHGRVSDGGNGVGFSGQRDFSHLHEAAFLDGFLGERKVLVFERKKSHMVRDLSRDRPDSASGCYGGKRSIYFRGLLDSINIIALKSFGRREREA